MRRKQMLNSWQTSHPFFLSVISHVCLQIFKWQFQLLFSWGEGKNFHKVATKFCVFCLFVRLSAMTTTSFKN